MISELQRCQPLPEVRQKRLFVYISVYAYIKETFLLRGKPHSYRLSVLQTQTAILNATNSPYSDEERIVLEMWNCPPFVLQQLIMEKHILLILFSHVGYDNLCK